MSLFGRRETRAVTYQDIWGSDSDFWTPTDYSTFVPVFSAVRLLADAVAQTPLEAYDDAGRLDRQPLFLRNPSAFNRAYEWKYKLVHSLLIRGNAYGVITGVRPDGWPQSVEWLNPAYVDVFDDDNDLQRPLYTFRGHPIAADVLHIPAFPITGKVKGLSPIAAFASIVEVGTSAQQFARDWFRNNGVPGAILQHKKIPAIDKELAENLKVKFKDAVSGRDVLVMGADWDYQAVAMPADEAQFLATIKATANQVAAIYGVPPERIGGEASSSRSYSNLDMDLRYLRQTSVGGWLTQIEQAIDAVTPPSKRVLFNMDAGIRADAKTRAETHEINLRTGVETLDEARRDENKPPLTAAEQSAWMNRYGRPQPQGSTTA